MRISVQPLAVLATVLAALVASGQIRPDTTPAEIHVITLPGAAIFLDDVRVGNAPAKGPFILRSPTPGAHVLRVEEYKKRTFTQKIVVTAGITLVRATLADYTGDLEVFTIPHAEVLVNGKSRGTADDTGRLVVLRLTAETYAVGARKQGYSPVEQSIDLAPDVLSTITLDLKPFRALPSAGRPGAGPTFTVARRLVGHDRHSRIWGAFFLPENGQVVSWASDGLVIVWDPKTGRRVRTLDLEFGNRYYLVSRDLSWAAFSYFYGNRGEQESKVGWGKLAPGEFAPRFAGAAVGFTDDSKSLVTVDHKHRTAVLRDLESGREVRRFVDDSVGEVALSSDGRWFATARGELAAIWDMVTGKKVHALPAQRGAQYLRPVFSPDSRRLALFARSYAQVFDVADSSAGAIIPAPRVPGEGNGNYEFYDLVFTPDGNHLISSHNPFHLFVWSVASGEQVWSAKAAHGGHLAVSKDGRSLVAFDDHDLTVWLRDQ